MRRLENARAVALGLLLGAVNLTAASSAFAFCRTTTCDSGEACEEDPSRCCQRDPVTGCVTSHPQLYWPSSCVSYSVQEDGSEKLGISAETLSGVLEEVYADWLSVTCDGGSSLSLAVDPRGNAACDFPEYNEDKNATNANVWMFRDSGPLANGTEPSVDGAQIDASAFALTTVSFVIKTGEILDADVEFNSASADFTTTLEQVGVDLHSVAMHEAGHFFGLDHTKDFEATMRTTHSPGSITQRDLGQDDIDGICEIYPETRVLPGGSSCEPKGGYSPDCYEPKGCGCRAVGETVPAGSSAGAFGLGIFLFGLLGLRRRSRWS